MTTLTAEQRQEIEKAGAEPVRLEDPETHASYVLLKAEVYARIKPAPATDHFEACSIPEGKRRSQEAFLRDLPGLLARRRLHGRFALYHGDRQVGIWRSPERLFRKIEKLGLQNEDYDSGKIEPLTEDNDALDHPLCEFTEEEPSSLLDIEVHPMIRKAIEKHHREWEGLMKRYPYQWAAYRGDERLGTGKTKYGLYPKYLDRGVSRDELVVLGIGPPEEDEIDEEPSLPPQEPPPPDPIEVPPMIRKAVEKHHREWESLMEQYPYQWAAYRGDERLEIGKTKHGLYHKYLDRGLSLDELVVLGIGPPIEDEIDEEGLYDF